MKLETFTLKEDVLPVDLDGWIAYRAEKIVIVLHECDFRVDGYVAFRPDDIEGQEASQANAFHDKVIAEEKLLDAWQDRREWAYANYQELFARFAKDRELLSVERPGDYFLVGEVVDTDHEGVTLKCMAPDGGWDEEDEFVDWDEISLVRWRSNYLTMLRKHGAKRPD